MTEMEKAFSEKPYKAWLDGLPELRLECKKKLFAYNHMNPEVSDEERTGLLRSILSSSGENVCIEAPFMCDYGKNIEVGDNFFANYNCVILDVGKVRIGNNVLFAPNVGIYTAGHPVHAEPRNEGLEYGIDITIGNNVWLCGNVIVNPGVTIGDNVVIGSGSVVTKDIESGVIAAGNPCKVIRKITDEDKNFYFKDRKF